MTPRRFQFGLIFVLLAAGSGLWADETAETAEVATAEATARPETAAVGQESAAPQPDCSPAESLDGQPLFEVALDTPESADMSGCTASYACVHGGSVSCSGPTGTCTSSGQGCGVVVCNGVATFCPGACNGNDWSCASFCYQTYGSMDGYCDLTRCCVCL